MRYIFLLMIIVPAAEISVLLLSGNTIGLWPTLAIILITGVLGAYLAKNRALKQSEKYRTSSAAGKCLGMPFLMGPASLLEAPCFLHPDSLQMH